MADMEVTVPGVWIPLLSYFHGVMLGVSQQQATSLGHSKGGRPAD